LALVLRGCWLGIDQSWIDPGAAAGGEGDVAGVVVGPSVAGAARARAGVRGSELMDGVSAGLSSSLCGGFSRVNGGLPGAAG